MSAGTANRTAVEGELLGEASGFDVTAVVAFAWE